MSEEAGKLHVQSGVERSSDGKSWRAIVYVANTRTGEVREYAGEWFEGLLGKRLAEDRHREMMAGLGRKVADLELGDVEA